MRKQGKITRWDDERGFGFISWHEDEDSVFVHIKAFMGTSRRPAIGEVVSFELTQGTNGKTRAEKVRFADQPEPQKPTTARRRSGKWPMILASLFGCFIVASALFNRIPWFVVGAYAAMSLATFFAYALDKSSAKRGAWRTPESTLHMLGLAGGWPGGLAAQRLLRHKSSKQQFLFVFWITVILNIIAVGYVVWSGSAVFINSLIDQPAICLLITPTGCQPKSVDSVLAGVPDEC